MIAHAVLAAVVLAATASCAAPLGPASEARRPPTVPLAACRIAGSDSEARCGTHRVFNSRQILIRHAAHVYFHECLRDVVSDFVAKASTRDLDVGCVETLRRPPFVAELPPPRTPR